jgi:hypothetical protein
MMPPKTPEIREFFSAREVERASALLGAGDPDNETEALVRKLLNTIDDLKLRIEHLEAAASPGS